MSASKTSSATTTRSAGSSSAAVLDIGLVLPAPGWPANTIESRACTQAGSRRSDLVQWGMLTARVAAFLRDADELADVHEDMPDAGHVAVDDVDAGAVVELGVMQAVSRTQLAVGIGRVVEQLGRRPQHVVVVMEDLVVVSRWPPEPFFATTVLLGSC
jgi:hypothetical protein